VHKIWDKRSQITLESALGSGGFWTRMGFMPMQLSEADLHFPFVKTLEKEGFSYAPSLNYFVSYLLTLGNRFDGGPMEMSPLAAVAWISFLAEKREGKSKRPYEKILQRHRFNKTHIAEIVPNLR